MTGPKAGERISEYVLVEQIGVGSFGQVWKAHHHIWKSDTVAVKVPTDSQYVRNLQKEGIAIHGLRHPNIVRAIGLDPFADVPYLVMEYVDGLSLAGLIEKHPRGLPPSSVQQITVGILRALEHAHANGVIHRDIKPANVLVAGAGRKPVETLVSNDVKVTDFGLGQAGEVTTASILQSGSLVSEEGRSISGTLAYMAPEQRDGGQIDNRSDLYSVGIVLFEMCCGERPSGGDLPSHIRPGLPSWVDSVFSRLYTRRDRRLASATEALAMIDAGSVPPIIRSSDHLHSRPVGTAVGGSCPACDGRVERDDNFCIHCGAQLVTNPRRCEHCGGYPGADDRFCVFCGGALPERVG